MTTSSPTVIDSRQLQRKECPKRSRTRTKKTSTSPTTMGRVRKSSAEKREHMKTLEKLRMMVGSNEKASQLEIVQHVIDHIYRLREELNNEPAESLDGAESPDTEAEAANSNEENLSPARSLVLQKLNIRLASMLKS